MHYNSTTGYEGTHNELQGKFQCPLCGKLYKWLRHLNRHRDICGDKNNPKFSCPICKSAFTRADTLTRHYKRKHLINEQIN